MSIEKSLENYRKGAIGSLLDEYEKALSELVSVLQKASADDYTRTVEGEDHHCRSIQVIMNHVIRAGYGYSKYIREALSMDVNPVEDKQIPQAEIGDEIDKMFAYTAAIFEGERGVTDEEMHEIIFKTRRDSQIFMLTEFFNTPEWEWDYDDIFGEGKELDKLKTTCKNNLTANAFLLIYCPISKYLNHLEKIAKFWIGETPPGEQAPTLFLHTVIF